MDNRLCFQKLMHQIFIDFCLSPKKTLSISIFLCLLWRLCDIVPYRLLSLPTQNAMLLR